MSEALKIRIVGALVLLAILAIAWPFLFDNADEISLSKESQIPSPPAVEEWQVQERDRPDEGKIAWPGYGDANVNEDDKASAKEPDSESSEPDQQSEESLKEPTHPPLREAWSVQVASLSDLDNGRKLVAKLQADGYRAYGQELDDAGRKVMRVFVGPKFDKRQADSIKLRVDKAYSVKSMVVRYTPVQ